MIKLSFCLHRLPGLSREEFQKYWFEKHAPLVKKHSSVLRIRRYVQTHAVTTPMNDAIRASREAPEMYDGVAELWWGLARGLDGAGRIGRRTRRRPRPSARRAQVH